MLIVGGGASGTAAGVTSSRLGINSVIIEETSWLGGMLTSAGVSAIDGNYNLQSGFFGEYIDSLASYYGGMESLKTGWVSSVLYEPSVGNKILNNIVSKEQKLSVEFNSSLKSIQKRDERWYVEVETPEGIKKYNPKIVIDATELGDVADACGVGYDIGMDSRDETGEKIAPEKSNDIIQDLTYVAILKDYGYDVTIPRPANYDSTHYLCSSINDLCVSPKEPDRMWSKEKMITYGKLPNNKYMINWPIEGNDYYLDIIRNNTAERNELLQQAKDFTLGFIYFIQTELGMNTLSLADDEFPTSDNLPFIPYHRESRRIHGVVQFNMNHITDPFTQEQKLYRTSVAVGDYPIDHHHARYPDWDKLPNLYFYPVPSYGLPLGVMIPKNVEDLIVAEKSISVSNLVNGTTRLQPVVLQIGQVAGTLASLAVLQNKSINNVLVRDVQKILLDNGSYLLPYLDVEKKDKLFLSLQRIGVTGIMKGIGRNEGWANQTWFRSNDLMDFADLEGLKDFYPEIDLYGEGYVTLQQSIDIVSQISKLYNIEVEGKLLDRISEIYIQFEFPDLDLNRNITRGEMAVILDNVLNPFEEKHINIFGEII
ncbi:MAG: FAD-dependent oxidoreductase [Proteiniphilum sp.]|nr:FAD-dependent oxidoreductase [Proteiniphilum sp.]